MIVCRTFFFFQRHKINKNDGGNHITKHGLSLEELDDRDEEGETEWLLDAPEYAYEVVVDAIGGDW